MGFFAAYGRMQKLTRGVAQCQGRLLATSAFRTAPQRTLKCNWSLESSSWNHRITCHECDHPTPISMQSNRSPSGRLSRCVTKTPAAWRQAGVFVDLFSLRGLGRCHVLVVLEGFLDRKDRLWLLDGELELRLAVVIESGSGRDQVTHDHVFLEAAEIVDAS